MNREQAAKIKFVTYLAEEAEAFAPLIPNVSLTPRAGVREALVLLVRIAFRFGLEIEDMDDDCDEPRATLAGDVISVNVHHTLEQQVMATLHQIAHRADPKSEEPDGTWEHREIVAEAAATLAAVQMGLPIERLAITVLAEHGATVEVMSAVMDRVLAVALEIEVAVVQAREGWTNN